MDKNTPCTGYCIFTDFFFQCPQPTVSDGEGKYIVFETELEAQREIADNLITHLHEFLDGHRDFEDATSIDEYVVPVIVQPDGKLTDESGKSFPSHAD